MNNLTSRLESAIVLSKRIDTLQIKLKSILGNRRVQKRVVSDKTRKLMAQAARRRWSMARKGAGR